MRRYVGLLILCGFLSACSGDGGRPNYSPAPTTAHPSSVAASPSATRTGPLTTGPGVKPGETPPTPDKYALQHSSQGALNFASYFYKSLDWSLATTDTFLLKQASAPSCESCQYYIKELDSLAATGGHVEGGRLHVTGVVLSEGTLSAADYVVEVRITQEAVQEIAPGSAPSPAGSATSDAKNFLYLQWHNGWQVTEIGK